MLLSVKNIEGIEQNTMAELETSSPMAPVSSASGDASISNPGNQIQMIPLPVPPPQKKKRNLPGMPGNFIETSNLT